MYIEYIKRVIIIYYIINIGIIVVKELPLALLLINMN